MRLPTRESIEGLRPISRNLSIDLIAAIGYGVSGALISTLLPTIARRGGLEPLGLAALSAAPFLTNLLSVFAGRFGPRTTWQFALLRAVGAGVLATLVVLPGNAVIIAIAVRVRERDRRLVVVRRCLHDGCRPVLVGGRPGARGGRHGARGDRSGAVTRAIARMAVCA